MGDAAMVRALFEGAVVTKGLALIQSASVLFSGRFRPNSPVLPRNRLQIFKLVNRTGSITSSSEFGQSKKEVPFGENNTTICRRGWKLSGEEQ
jgi:hypothetical protein